MLQLIKINWKWSLFVHSIRWASTPYLSGAVGNRMERRRQIFQGEREKLNAMPLAWKQRAKEKLVQPFAMKMSMYRRLHVIVMTTDATMRWCWDRISRRVREICPPWSRRSKLIAKRPAKRLRSSELLISPDSFDLFH